MRQIEDAYILILNRVLIAFTCGIQVGNDMDWITGDKFIGLADFTFSPSKKVVDDYDNLANALDIGRLKDVNLVYTHTMYAKQLFNVIGDLPNKFIVITHNSDVNVDFSPPDNVIKWFSQNVNITHPKIESIPIGLENDRWFVTLHKKEKMLTKLQEPRKYRNLLYINHNVGTNPAQRLEPYMIMRGKRWVTMERRSNGDRFDEYMDDVYNHNFVICPEGNGMDTHRTWECLYMGTIPIEKRNLNNRFYTDLPIMFVNDWGEINEEYLMKWLTISGDIDWNMGMLTFEYWKNKINGTLL